MFLFASNGVVIRHLRNRDAEVLFPSGVRATFNKQEMSWTIVNNKGFRMCKKDGHVWDMDPIPCAYETDATTGARVMIRDDKVMTIEYADGSLLCQHPDGTLMRTSADSSEIRIEKDGYAPVLFKRAHPNQNGELIFSARSKVEGPANLSPDQRTFDQVIVETHLPDSTVVDTYLDSDLGHDQPGIQHIFKRPDFSIVAINQQDRIKVISSNARSALNEGSSKSVLG